MHRTTVYYILFLAAAVLVVGYLFTPRVTVTLSQEDSGVHYELFHEKPLPGLYAQKVVKYKKKRGEAADSLKFVLPFGTPTRRFRLDLGNRGGQHFTLSEIMVSSWGGFVRRSLGPGNFDRIRLASQIKEVSRDDKSIVLRTTGSDPYILFDMDVPASFHFPTVCFFLLLLTGATLLPLVFPARRESAEQRLMTIGKKIWSLLCRIPRPLLSPYLWLPVFFLTAFAFGITGSSIGLIRNGCISDPVGEKKLWGHYQGIRSDEFLAHGTATAIQSYKNVPRFDLINDNIGLSGRNFLFFHDWGAPVKHFSMLIRPSNWMFFLTDLRHALSWYWLFPIFFGIFSLSFLMDCLFGKGGWLHFVAAVGLVFSPYCACWSFWPINCSAGAFLAAAALVRLFQSGNRAAMFGWALLAGWSFSVSAATLYFPHIWPCVTLAVLAAVCKIIMSRKNDPGRPCWKTAAFLFFLLTAGVLLYIFFDAIQEPLRLAMKSASGKRIRDGGLFQVWELFRGWLFPVTFYHDVYINQCEAQAYQFIFIPLLLVFQWKYKDLAAVRPLCWTLIGFLLWSFTYQFIGLPHFLTRITGWDHCTEPRVCYAVQVAQVLLLVSLAGTEDRRFSRDHLAFPMFLGICLTCLAVVCFWWSPESLRTGVAKLGYSRAFGCLALSVLLFLVSTSVILCDPRIGVIVFALISGIPGMIFNPVCLAPTDVRSPLVDEVKNSPGLRYGGRVLLVGNSLVAGHQQQYVMAGGKVFNGFFCYEDSKIFDLLFKDLPNAASLHRLNHMSVLLTADRKVLSAEIPQGDCIRLRLNGAKFDFSTLPVDFVINLVYNGNRGLDRNPSVVYCKTCQPWQLWRVKHRGDTASPSSPRRARK